MRVVARDSDETRTATLSLYLVAVARQIGEFPRRRNLGFRNPGFYACARGKCGLTSDLHFSKSASMDIVHEFPRRRNRGFGNPGFLRMRARKVRGDLRPTLLEVGIDRHLNFLRARVFQDYESAPRGAFSGNALRQRRRRQPTARRAPRERHEKQDLQCALRARGGNVRRARER
jgi:hypothetical protein